MTQRLLHLNTVNAEIRKAGIHVRAMRGDGYYYFHTEAGEPIDASSVYVYRAHHLTIAAWLDEARKAEGLARDQGLTADQAAADPGLAAYAEGRLKYRIRGA